MALILMVVLLLLGLYCMNSLARQSRNGLGCGVMAMLCVGGLALLYNPMLLLLAGVLFYRTGAPSLFSALFPGGTSKPSDHTFDTYFSEPSHSKLQVDPLRLVKEKDPNFSLPIFREFAVLLYSQALQEMPDGKFVHSRPFLSPQVVRQLTTRGSMLEQVQDVVVGFLKVRESSVKLPNLVLRVELESNYLIRRDGQTKGYVALETWTFERKQSLLTQPPKAVSKLSCPSCGYGGDFPANGVCPQCQTTNAYGQFDWVVTGISITELNELKPHQAEGGGEEAGTTLPTRVHPQLKRVREEFLTRHPDFSFNEFWLKASSIFLKLQQAWSDRDPGQCRPHETDVLFRMHRYWIDDYRRGGRINRLSDIRIKDWELSKIELDAYYESITARVYASMIDVTTDEGGMLLYGDPKLRRSFTEYWTFIRRVGGKQAKGDSVHSCPSCGAPLDRINQTGECEYCHTVITLGDFDWVLSNIEQDEVYEP